MTPILQMVVLGLSLCVGAAADGSSASTRSGVSDAKAKIERVTIPVEGMGCDSCAENLQHRLSALEGVVEAVVDFDKKEARVRFDSRKVSVKRLVAEIDKAFTAGKPRKEHKQ